MADVLDDCLQRNPYVGPRPIQTGETFLAREREARGLVQRIVSSRVVLLHSPSGAGKTSLIQAAVLPAFRERGFQLCVAPGKTLAPLRVNARPPEGVPVANRYVFSGLQALLGDQYEAAELGRLTLAEAFDQLRDDAEPSTGQLVVFDQLEEVLTLDPTDREGQEEFFDQLGEALEDPQRWALLSMREDFMGGLDRFLTQVPGQLRSTYRLDFMEEAAALRAICGPAERWDVKVAPDAAAHLVDDLRRVKGNGFDDTADQSPGPYVQPVLLQVACHNLWRKLCKTSPHGFTEITLQNVTDSGRVESALRRYYNDVIQEATAEVAPGDLPTERVLREWIENGLITADGHRNQVQAGPAVPGQDEVLQLLNDRYLIRSDVRDGTRWWELSHDRLVAGVLRGNAAWRRERLEFWQNEALEWDRGGREDDSYLLDENECRAARRSLARLGDTATDVERRFVERSERALTEKSNWRAVQLNITVLVTLLVLSLASNAVLCFLLLR